uniref:CADH2 n=1 Tax=Poeciliopsis prolifica TaxID=188132 RepID=A0A0S7EIF2_9TELE
MTQSLFMRFRVLSAFEIFGHDWRDDEFLDLCGRHHFDLCHPLLLSGGVYSLDQQGRSRGWSALKSPCSVNYSVVLYPKVRWIAAFKPHQTTSATADKLHVERGHPFSVISGTTTVYRSSEKPGLHGGAPLASAAICSPAKSKSRSSPLPSCNENICTPDTPFISPLRNPWKYWGLAGGKDVDK